MNSINNETPAPHYDEEPEEVEVSFVSGRSAVRDTSIKGGALELSPEERLSPTPLAIAGYGDGDNRGNDGGNNNNNNNNNNDNDNDNVNGDGVDIDAEAFEQLRRARELLRKNELDAALPLAMDVLRKRPTMSEAKTLIARCYINRREYTKARAILQSIPNIEKNADASYYLGLCKARMGDIQGAVTALEKGIESASATGAGATGNGGRMEELLRHLHDGDAACPECGRETRYGSMKDVGDRTLCADCANAVLRKTSQARRKPGSARTEPGGSFLFRAFRRAGQLLIAGAVLWLGLYAASAAAPDAYKKIRSHLPASWRFLPKTAQAAATAAPLREQPISRHETGVAHAAANSRPSARTRMFSEPHFQRLHPLGNPGPDGKIQLMTADFDGDGATEIAVVQGRYGKGRASILHETADGLFHPISEASFPGRPAGSGIIQADGDTFIVVADYSNSCIRRFAVADSNSGSDAGGSSAGGSSAYGSGGVSERPTPTLLPGKPVLAGFNQATGTFAALCKTGTTMRLTGHRLVSADYVEKLGDWDAPQGHVWRKLLALPDLGIQGEYPRFLLIGGNSEKSIFLFSPGRDAPIHVKPAFPGIIVDAIPDRDGRVHCLIDDNGKWHIAGFRLDSAGSPVDATVVPLGEGPFVNGMTALVHLVPEKVTGVAVLSATRVGLALSDPEKKAIFTSWELPVPSRLAGSAVVLPGKQDEPDRIAYQDSDGTLWSMGLSTTEAEAEEKAEKAEEEKEKASQ